MADDTSVFVDMVEPTGPKHRMTGRGNLFYRRRKFAIDLMDMRAIGIFGFAARAKFRVDDCNPETNTMMTPDNNGPTSMRPHSLDWAVAILCSTVQHALIPYSFFFELCATVTNWATEAPDNPTLAD